MAKRRKEPGFTLRLPGGPIDWTAWQADMAEQARPKGITPEHRRKMVAARAEAQKRKRRELAERESERLRLKLAEAVPVRKSLTNEEMILGNMEPGTWYSVRDLHEVSGVLYQSCKAMGPKFWQEGLFARIQNPDWKPPAKVGGPQLPKWLYGLTAKALGRSRAAAALR